MKAHNNQWFDATVLLDLTVERINWPEVTATQNERNRAWTFTFRADNGADAIGKVHEIIQRGTKTAPDKYKLMHLQSQLTGVVDDVPLVGPNPDVRVKHKRAKDTTLEMFSPAEVERQHVEGSRSRENEAWR